MAQAKKKSTVSKKKEDVKTEKKSLKEETPIIKEAPKKDDKDGITKKDIETSSHTGDKGQEVTTAKSGKRSTKALKEAEEKAEKEARKSQPDTEEQVTKPKRVHNPSRPKIQRRSKKYQEVHKLIDKNKEYTLKEALDVAIKTNPAKFDATVEIHMNLNVDPKQADQNIRGSIVLPSGTGKISKITVIAEEDDAKKAKTAGADNVGNEEIFADLDKGILSFDVLIATPVMMPKLGKYAKILGPKGLMPNPKSGTVTKDVAKAVKEAKAGRVEYRVDSTGIIHLGVGKVSFGANKLEANIQSLLSAIKTSKPASIKGIFVKSIYVTTSMGPSIKISANSI